MSTRASADAMRERRDSPHGVPPGSIELGKLCEFPLGENVFHDAPRLMSEARHWLLRYVDPLGSGDHLRHTIDETLSMCSYLYPEGSYEGVLLATIFLTLGFVVDDIFDGVDIYRALGNSDAGQRVLADLETLRCNPRTLTEGMLFTVKLIKDPDADFRAMRFPDDVSGELFLHNAFHDFAQRMHGFGAQARSSYFPAWLQTFGDSFAHFCLSHANIYNKLEETTVEQYAEHKFINSGMLHTIHILELAMGSFLSPSQHKLPLVIELTTRCRRIGSLLNEITSYEKEVFHEKAGNLLLVMMMKQGVSLEVATRHVIGRIQNNVDRVISLLRDAHREFTGDDDDSRKMLQYVRGIEMITAACWHWQLNGTTRYKSITSPFAELLIDTQAPTKEANP
jgi:hypothetical protein